MLSVDFTNKIKCISGRVDGYIIKLKSIFHIFPVIIIISWKIHSVLMDKFVLFVLIQFQ